MTDDSHYNPVDGCDPVDEDCDNCYAAAFARRFWKKQGRLFSDVRCHPERLDYPRTIHEPKKIFVNSMGGIWHPAVPKEFLDDLFDVMTKIRRHTYQILTKRPKRALDYLLTNPPARHIQIGTSVGHQQAIRKRIPWLIQIPAHIRFASVEREPHPEWSPFPAKLNK
jgi:protein gp37